MHSSNSFQHDNFLPASEIIYFEDKKRIFAKRLPSNFIAKELYNKLNENDRYVVWHKGGELSLSAKFYIKRKDGREIFFKSLTHTIPFYYNVN